MYQLMGTRHYRFTVQRRGAKVINSIEQALLTSIASTDSIKFNENLEKNGFNDRERDGQRNVYQTIKKKRSVSMDNKTFYSIEYEDEVLSLFEHYHKVTVEEVIVQHESRCEEPEPELDASTNQETPESQMH